MKLFSPVLGWVFFLSLVCVFHAPLQAKSDQPQRIASTHQCTDQLVVMLADPAHIVSLSHFAGNEKSPIADQAGHYPANRGLAEELAILKPDVIFTSTFGNASVLLLEDLGYRVVNIPVANTIHLVRKNIMAVANAIGEHERGREVLKEFDRSVEENTADDRQYRPLLAMYQANGYTAGSRTLKSQLVELAGFRNLAAELEILYDRHLPLELLVTQNLDGLMIATHYDHPALAHELPNHPAIQQTFKDVPTVSVDEMTWICGTPFIVQALKTLRAFHAQIINARQ